MGSTRSINIANGMPLRKRKYMPTLRSRTPSSFHINSVNRSPMGVNRFGNKSYQNLLGASLDPRQINRMKNEQIDWQQINWEQMNQQEERTPLNRFSVSRRYTHCCITTYQTFCFSYHEIANLFENMCLIF